MTGFQFTIRQMTIAAAIVGLILALAEWARQGDERAIMALGIIWFTSPVWGSMGLAFLLPSVTRGLFLASFLVVLPFVGYFSFRYSNTEGIGANEWLLWFMAFLWSILPFGIGHVVSKEFHAWRARNRPGRDGARRSPRANGERNFGASANYEHGRDSGQRLPAWPAGGRGREPPERRSSPGTRRKQDQNNEDVRCSTSGRSSREKDSRS